MDEKQLQALYNAVSAKFNIGDFATFKGKMATADDRKRFYEVVGQKGFDLGDYNAFETRLAGVKKKDAGTPPAGNPSPAPAKPSFNGVKEAIAGASPLPSALNPAAPARQAPTQKDFEIVKGLGSVTPQQRQAENAAGAQKTLPQQKPLIQSQGPQKLTDEQVTQKAKEQLSDPLYTTWIHHTDDPIGAVQQDVQQRNESLPVDLENYAHSLHEREQQQRVNSRMADILAQGYFAGGRDALAYLQKAGVPVGEMSAEQLSQIQPKTVTEKVALQKAVSARQVDDLLKKYPFEEAALRFATPDLNGKTYEQFRREDNATAGAHFAQFINNPDVQERAQHDTRTYMALQTAKNTLAFQFPQFAEAEIASLISKKLDESGKTNYISNNPSKEQADWAVKELEKEGKLPWSWKELYQKNIVPKINTATSWTNEIARGIPIANAFSDENPIHSKGVFENALASYRGTLKGAAKTVEEATTTPLATLVNPRGAADIDAFDRNEAAGQTQFEPEGGGKVSATLGNIAGMLLPTMSGAGGLKAMGASESMANALAFAFSTAGQHQIDARQHFKNNPALQGVYTAGMSALDAILGGALSKGLTKGAADAIKRDVAVAIEDYTTGKLSGAAAKDMVKNSLTKNAGEVLTEIAKHNTKGAGMMAAPMALDATLQELFGDHPQDLHETSKAIAKEFQAAWWATTFLAAIPAYGKVRGEMTWARAMHDQVTNPEYRNELVKNGASQEALKNYDTAVQIYRELSESGVSPKDLPSLLLHETTQKALSEKLANTQSLSIREKLKSQITQSKEEAQKILDRQDVDLRPQDVEGKKTAAVVRPQENKVPSQVITIAPKEVPKEEVKGAKVVLPQSNPKPNVVEVKPTEPVSEPKQDAPPPPAKEEESKQGARHHLDFSGAMTGINHGLEMMDADIRSKGESVIKNIDKATPEQKQKIYNDFNELKQRHEGLEIAEDNNQITIRKTNEASVQQPEPFTNREQVEVVNQEAPTTTEAPAPVAEAPTEKTRQEHINDLVDRAAAYRNMSRKDKSALHREANEIKLRAKELGLSFDKKHGRLYSPNSRFAVNKRNAEAATNRAKDFSPSDYHQDTHTHVKTVSEAPEALHGMPIVDNNGKALTQAAVDKALQSIRDGKPTYGAKAIYAFVQKAVEDGHVELEDRTTGQRAKVPIKEYFDAFKNVKEQASERANDHDFTELNTLLSEDAGKHHDFETLFETIKNNHDERNNTTGETPGDVREPKPQTESKAGSSHESSTTAGEPDRKVPAEAVKTPGRFEAKAKALADKINGTELPKWLRGVDDPTIHKQGLGAEDLKRVLSEAIVNVGKLMDSGVELAEAIKRGADHIIDHYKAELGKYGGKLKPEFEKTIREGFAEHYREQFTADPDDLHGIRHADNDKRRERLGMEAYDPGHESEAQWEAEGQVLLQEKYNGNPENLLNALEKRDSAPTPQENAILKAYGATLDKLMEENPTAEVRRKAQRFAEIDSLEGSQAGRSLASRKGPGRSADTLTNAILDEAESLSVRAEDLTEERVRQVQKEYEDLKRLRRELEESMTKHQAEVELLEQQKAALAKQKKQSRPPKEPKASGGASKPKKTSEDFVRERKKILSDIRADLLKAAKGAGGLQASVPGYAQFKAIAPHIPKLVRNLLEQGVTKLEDVTTHIYNELKDVVPGVTKRDVRDLIAGKYNERKVTRNELAAKARDLQLEADLLNKIEQALKGEKPTTEKAKYKQAARLKELREKLEELRKRNQKAEREGRSLSNEDLARREERRLVRELDKAQQELDDLKNGTVKQKDPKQEVQLSDRAKALQQRLQEVRGEILDLKAAKAPKAEDPNKPAPTEAELYNRERRSILRRLAALQADVKAGRFEKEPVKRPRIKLRPEDQARMDEIIKIEQQQKLRRARAEFERKSRFSKSMHYIWEAMGARRLINAAVDASIIFRQAVHVSMNPFKLPRTYRAIKQAGGVAFSPKEFQRFQYEIEHSDLGRLFMEVGGVLSNPIEHSLEKHEEQFMQNIFHRIGHAMDKTGNPVLKGVVKGVDKAWFSERVAAGVLNTIRMEEFDRKVKALERAGVTMDNAPEKYKAAAGYVMNMTGRGKLLKMLEDSHAGRMAANNTFFGARLMASRINLLNPMYYKSLPKELRMEVLKDMAGYSAGLVLTAMAAKAAGASVSTDYNDSDFLQIRFGDKVYDISGGSAAYVRTFLRLAETAFRIGKNPSHIDRADKSYAEFGGKSVFNTMFVNKLAPNNSYLYHAITGHSGDRDENGHFKPFDPYEVLDYWPMYVDDVRKGYAEDGFGATFSVLAPNIFGVGYQGYPDKAPAGFGGAGAGSKLHLNLRMGGLHLK